MTSKAGSDASELVFIHVSNRTDEARRHNGYLAKSHTSRVNRRKASATKGLSRLDPRPNGSIQSVHQALVGRRESNSSNTVESEPESSVSSNTANEDGTFCTTVLPLTRPLSPVFGALAAETFAVGLNRTPGEAAEYCMFNSVPVSAMKA